MRLNRLFHEEISEISDCQNTVYKQLSQIRTEDFWGDMIYSDLLFCVLKIVNLKMGISEFSFVHFTVSLKNLHYTEKEMV